MGGNKLSSAPNGDESFRSFRVTHPFHPLSGKEYKLVARRLNWGRDRVYFYDDSKELASMPAAWTSVVLEDPFITLSQGRSYFRFEDLGRLAKRLNTLLEGKPM